MNLGGTMFPQKNVLFVKRSSHQKRIISALLNNDPEKAIMSSWAIFEKVEKRSAINRSNLEKKDERKLNQIRLVRNSIAHDTELSGEKLATWNQVIYLFKMIKKFGDASSV